MDSQMHHPTWQIEFLGTHCRPFANIMVCLEQCLALEVSGEGALTCIPAMLGCMVNQAMPSKVISRPEDVPSQE